MTFRNRHSFIGGFLCAALFVSGGCALGGCTEITEPQGIGNADENGRMPLIIRATVSDYTAIGEENTPSTRIPTENGFNTEFNEGDAIGIFALKEYETPYVTPVDGVYNLKLVYTKATDGSGSWVPADDTKALYSYDDELAYIAYYPYRDGVTIKRDSKTEIFKKLANDLPPATDQSTPAAYTGSDLMAAFATPTTDPSDANKKVLTLAFEHLHALLVLKTNRLFNCIPPTGAGFEYSNPMLGADATAKDAVINGIKALSVGDGIFRAIVKTTSSNVIPTGNYKTTGDKTVLYTGDAVAGATLTAGKYYTQQVDMRESPESIIRPLQKGDFFYSDGKILPYEANSFSSSVLGIVFHVGPGEGDSIDNYVDTNITGDIHGYVMALNDAYPSDTDKKWGKRQVYFGTEQTTQFDGYTKKYAEQTHELCQAAAEIRNFRTAVPVPSTASNWYMPSYAQLKTIWDAYKHSEEGVIYRSLQKVGGDLFANQNYWTVTELSLHDIWCINMQTGVANNIGKCSGLDMSWPWVAYGGIHLTRVVLTF